LREQVRNGVEARLSTEGRLHSDQVSRWMDQQRATARFFNQGGQVADNFAAWQADGFKDRARVERILARLDEYQAAYGHDRISLYDLNGKYRLSRLPDPIMAEHRPEAIAAIHEGKPILVDFHLHGDPAQPMLGMMFPLISGHGSQAGTVGAMFIAFPARQSLMPMIGATPVSSATGETVLARQRGERIELMLSSRPDAPPPLSLYRQVQDPRNPAARVARGQHGILHDCVDYRGAAVLAYGARIPGTPWILITKMDQAEADASFQDIALYSALATGLILLISSLSFWFWWRGQITVQRAQLHGKELERRVLQRRYDFLSRYAGDVILLADADGKILEINERVERQYGYLPDELKDRPVTILRPPDLLDEAWLRRDAILKAGSLIYQTEHQRKDGSRLPVEVSGHAIDIQGQTYFHLMYRDITERVAADEKLRTQALLLDQIQDHVTITDLRGVITYVNEAECRSVGRQRHELLGLHIDIFGNAPEADASQDEIARATLESGHWRGRIRNFRPDSTPILIDLRTSLIRDDVGKPLCMVGVGTDITDQNRAEQALAEREARYRAVIETSADGFWMTDLEARLLEVNQAYCQRSGYSRDELLAMRIYDLDAREKPEDTAAHMAQLIGAGGSVFETMHRAKDGTIWQVEVTTSYSPMHGGRVFVFLRDILRRNRSEALLKTRLQLSALSLKSSLDDVMQAALDAAEQFTESRIGFFHFVDPDQETLTLQAWSNNTIKNMCQADAKGLHYAISQAGVWVDAVVERRLEVIVALEHGVAHGLGQREPALQVRHG
jgi:PAS domain S-box-containing protein